LRFGEAGSGRGYAFRRARQRGPGPKSSKVTRVSAPASPTARQAELALVERCRQGELGAFEEVYRAHSGRLYNVAYRMLGNAADAEDLLQEIFLSAHRKLESFRGESALGTWLYRLAVNLCLDYLRSRTGRALQLTDSLEDETWLADAGSGRLAEKTVTKMDLERALAQLPEGCRMAFVLHDIEGLEHREIADALGIAEGTSKSQVHKARLRLRALLSR
jgi:RNA polymerase sigma-70 factor (ECF subfamily)